MKKSNKILALVLSMAMIFSTFVVPVAADASYFVNYSFTDANDAETFGGVSQADGFAGKAVSDKVAVTTASTSARDYANTFDTTTGYVTYETQVYIPDTSTQSYRMMAYNQGNCGGARSTLQIVKGVVQYNVANADHWNTMTSSDVKIESNTWNKLAMTWDFANQKVLFYVNGVKIGELTETLMLKDEGKASGDFGFGSSSTGVYVDNVRAYDAAYTPDTTIAEVSGASNGALTVAAGATLASVKAMITDGTAEIYKLDLTTAATELKDGNILIINKGELYKAYEINVPGMYDDAVLSVDFN